MKTFTFTKEQLPEIAKEFIDNIGDDRVFLFEGEMGSGKTTLISEICCQLGADDDFGSPTFSLVNEYADRNGNPIFHFDLYRLESLSEALDMGAEEYFNSGELCLVEWPDRLEGYLGDEGRKVFIKENEDGSRTIKF